MNEILLNHINQQFFQHFFFLTTSYTNKRHNVQVLKQIGLKPISYNRILYSIQSVSEGETSFVSI